jgi:arachidonate 15-lipoxygenase
MIIPTLPQYDRQPDLRGVSLATSRASVDFDHSRAGYILPSVVPAGQGLSFEWALAAETLAVATEIADIPGALEVAADDGKTPEERLAAIKPLLLHWLAHRPDAPARPFRPQPWQARAPLTVAEQMMVLGALPHPEGVARWDEDFFFGWQRIASDETGLLRLVTEESARELWARMPLSPAAFARVRPGDDLARALAEHRLMVCDLSQLEGIPAGFYEGWRRWLPAPTALFALSQDRRVLWPVAIQCGPVHSADFPVVTPLDGHAWRMARACYNGAESTWHGVVEHGALCHLMMGAISVATLRTLAPTHPIRVLLEPHFEMTIGIARATAELYVPGGRTPNLQSISVDGIPLLTDRGWSQFNWHDQTLDRHFASRGLGSREVMPDLPARDDLSLYSVALTRLARAYVAVYYATDADVQGDTELIEWVRTIRSSDGAAIPTFGNAAGRIDTVEELVDAVASILWRASPWHATVNYPVYETTAFAPAYPASLFAPPPRAGRTYEESDFLSLLPPEKVSRDLLVDLVQVSNLRLNRLGHYAPEAFRDPRVQSILAAFRQELDGIGVHIRERNRFRAIPWPFLDPQLVTASIHI